MYVSEDTLGLAAILLIAAFGSFSIWAIWDAFTGQSANEQAQKQQGQQRPATKQANPQRAPATAR